MFRSNWGKVLLTVILLSPPLLFEGWLTNKELAQNRRDDALSNKYECHKLEKCVADFDGDGLHDTIEVRQKPYSSVSDMGKSVKRTQFVVTVNPEVYLPGQYKSIKTEWEEYSSRRKATVKPKNAADDTGILDKIPTLQRPSLLSEREGFINNPQQVLALPYDSIDGSWRTRIALNREAGRDKLLVFDSINNSPPMQAVFAWQDKTLAQVTPSALDKEILRAMWAHDDYGGWNQRVIYRPIMRGVRIIAYYICVILVISVWAFKRKRKLPQIFPASTQGAL